MREVGRRIALETGEPRSTDFLLQRLSVAVQRGNCASVWGASDLSYFYVLILNIKCIIMSCANYENLSFFKKKSYGYFLLVDKDDHLSS